MKRHRDSFYGRGTLIAAIIIGMIWLFISVWTKENRDTYSLALSDESGSKEGEEHIGQAEPEREPDVWNLENTNIRVLLYSSDYRSEYHTELKIMGNDGEILLNKETLLTSFEEICEKLKESGYFLEQTENGYCLKREDGGGISQCSIARSFG